jgi:hypothetical protein
MLRRIIVVTIVGLSCVLFLHRRHPGKRGVGIAAAISSNINLAIDSEIDQ